jgi:hypothetical protein
MFFSVPDNDWPGVIARCLTDKNQAKRAAKFKRPKQKPAWKPRKMRGEADRNSAEPSMISDFLGATQAFH